MSELFRYDELTKQMFNMTISAKQKTTINELVKMNKEVIGSKVFGYVLYDNGTFPVMDNIDREFFSENYIVILSAMSQAGVYDSYTFLIKQVLGAGVSIEYQSPKPRHLIINIDGIDGVETAIVSSNGSWLTAGSGAGLVATKANSEFTVNQLIKVLEVLANPSGTYLDLRFGESFQMLKTDDQKIITTNDDYGILVSI